MNYQVERWKRKDWRKGSRSYSCEVKQDLFGRWLVVRRWGRVSAAVGQCREEVCERYDQGVEIFEAVGRRREKRGYRSW